MDNFCPAVACDKGKIVGGRKCHPNALKDVKRKLSFMNKKIGDLHHQRTFAYKNSVKVKKMVHNQVNQIVKCLRARERILLSDVDEAYISQDAKISDELSKLQSVHSRCQTLLNNLDDFRSNTDVFSKIYSVFAEINFGEKPATKPLEFVSDFEAMKTKANNYGYLEGDFMKKDDFVLVDDKKENVFSDVVYKPLPDKDEWFDQTLPVSNTDTATLKNYLDEVSACKEINTEDSFQIIDLFGNMCCEDEEDYIMAENVIHCNQQLEKESTETSCKNEREFSKMGKSLEKSYEANRKIKDFNPEEEWTQILEMNKKIANFKEMTLKLHDEKQIDHEIHKNAGEHKNTGKLNDKKCKQNRFILLKEADNWLYNVNSKHNMTRSERIFESKNIGTNFTSPAELIRKAFQPYFTTGNAKNWLSSY